MPDIQSDDDESPLTPVTCCCYPIRTRRYKTTGWREQDHVSSGRNAFSFTDNNKRRLPKDNGSLALSERHKQSCEIPEGNRFQKGDTRRSCEIADGSSQDSQANADDTTLPSLKPVPNDETQDANACEESVSFEWYDAPLALAGAVLYVVDVYTDVRLALQFLLEEHHLIFGSVTLTFVALAYLVTCGFALKEYWRMYRSTKGEKSSSACVWAVRVIGAVLMLGPLVNTAEFLYNLFQTRRHRHCKDVCKLSNSSDRCGRFRQRVLALHMNNAFLRLFEACLEAAPQLVFQLYVLVVTKPEIRSVDGVWRIATVTSSWFSLAHTLTSFCKARRNSSLSSGQAPATLRHQCFDMLWRLAETGGRVLAIALFASHFRFWLLAVLAPHGLLMACWQYLQERDRSPLNVLGYLVYAYVFIFCFINNYCTSSGGHDNHSTAAQRRYSRIHFLVFYLLFYAENVAMLTAWYFFTTDQGQWFHLWAFVLGLALCPLHVTLQLLYYGCCHPSSTHIRVCVCVDRVGWKHHLVGQPEGGDEGGEHCQCK